MVGGKSLAGTGKGREGKSQPCHAAKHVKRMKLSLAAHTHVLVYSVNVCKACSKCGAGSLNYRLYSLNTYTDTRMGMCVCSAWFERRKMSIVCQLQKILLSSMPAKY